MLAAFKAWGDRMRSMMLVAALGLAACEARPQNSTEAAAAAIASANETLEEIDRRIEYAKPFPEWAVIEGKSPITDAPSVQIVTMSQTLDGVYGFKRVGLRVRCDEGELQAQFEWPTRVGKSATWPITIRFDGTPAEEITARYGRSHGYRMGRRGSRADHRATGWIKKAGGADRNQRRRANDT